MRRSTRSKSTTSPSRTARRRCSGTSTSRVPEGGSIAIVGPNGAGKTHAAQGDARPGAAGAGWVKIFGEPATAERSRVGYVPQRESVDWDFPTDALDVVMMGRYGSSAGSGGPARTTARWALDCLDKVGMADYAHRQISQLSGGQQQRVFLARALAQDASLYLMDEPFAGVDATTERAIVALLQELRSAGRTVVVVHHDLQTGRRVLRLGGPAQHAADRGGADARRCSPPRTCARRTAAG